MTYLDSIIRDFDKLGLPPNVNDLRSSLIQEIDRISNDEGRTAQPNGQKIKEIIQRPTTQQKWLKSRKSLVQFKESKEISDEEIDMLISLFDEENDDVRI